MDIITSHFTRTEASKINRIRIALNLITLSDIADLRGKNILQNIKTCINNRKSTYLWPRQPLPKRIYTLWRKACKIFQQYLSRNPLGPWYSTHQHWPWKESIDNTIISDGVHHYQQFISPTSSYYKLIHSPTLQLPNNADVPLCFLLF